MKIKFFTVFVIVTLLGWVSASAGQGKAGKSRRPADTINGLRLAVEIEGGVRKFHPDDSFEIKVKLTNVGKVPLTLYKDMGWGWSSSFFLSIVDARGRQLESAFLDDSLHRPPFAEEDFVTIKPGESLERENLVALEQYAIKAPGVYRVIVWYASPVPQEFAPAGLKIWGLDKGRLESKPVKFEVVK